MRWSRKYDPDRMTDALWFRYLKIYRQVPQRDDKSRLGTFTRHNPPSSHSSKEVAKHLPVRSNFCQRLSRARKSIVSVLCRTTSASRFYHTCASQMCGWAFSADSVSLLDIPSIGLRWRQRGGGIRSKHSVATRCWRGSTKQRPGVGVAKH